jgi:hypothetical protein
MVKGMVKVKGTVKMSVVICAILVVLSFAMSVDAHSTAISLSEGIALDGSFSEAISEASAVSDGGSADAISVSEAIAWDESFSSAITETYAEARNEGSSAYAFADAFASNDGTSTDVIVRTTGNAIAIACAEAQHGDLVTLPICATT